MRNLLRIKVKELFILDVWTTLVVQAFFFAIIGI